MAQRGQRIVRFLGSPASAAATAFNAAAARLGLPWAARANTADAADRIITFDAALDPSAEVWPADAELGSAVSQLIARLLGGGHEPPPTPVAPPKKGPILKVGRETAGRRGKGVTVIWDVPLGDEALKELAATLKQRCGTGGTAKDGRIEIQGEQRERICQELEKLGYRVKRSGG